MFKNRTLVQLSRIGPKKRKLVHLSTPIEQIFAVKIGQKTSQIYFKLNLRNSREHKKNNGQKWKRVKKKSPLSETQNPSSSLETFS